MTLTIGRLLREALWAPAAIVALNVVVAWLPDPGYLWSLLHFLGGAAAAFCVFQIARIAAPELRVLRYVLAFALACSAALAWECAEFAIDQVADTLLQFDEKTDSQHTRDLLLSVCGAALFLSFAALAEVKPR